MRRFLLSLTVLAALTAALVAPGLAIFGRPDNSSAIINRNPAGTEVTVQVQLKDALPNQIYTVRIHINGCRSVFLLGMNVFTNQQGNGSKQFKVGGGFGAPGIINDVVVTAHTTRRTDDFKQTPMVTFGAP
jgi:hypothetical protein